MASETTPLLQPDGDGTFSNPVSKRSLISPFRRLLLTSLLGAIAWVYTATPLIYSFRTILCDVLYDEGAIPPYEGSGDRCMHRLVESESSKAIALMVSFTTFSAVLNLLTTGYVSRRYGVKIAMVSQTAWPALRNLCQTTAIYMGGRKAIYILQWTQLITILGGGAGFFLSANTFVGALVLPEERTVSFGILQGVAMFGTAVGFILGGVTGDAFGAPAPFEVTFCLLILSTLLSACFLPYVPPTQPGYASTKAGESKPASQGIFAFLSPLRVFLPRMVDPEDGSPPRKYWGLTLLGTATFVGVLAVSYVPFLLQLTATNAFGFHPTENGVLMSANALSRAVFLTFIFPSIISLGRKWYTTSSLPPPPSSPPPPPQGSAAFEPQVAEGEGAEEAASTPAPTDVGHGSKFDLDFVRCSMVCDGILTAGTMLATRGWHLYVAAGIIPLASGTAPACKGVMMEMVPADQQPDALAAVALVEMMATLLTVSAFGAVFAFLSEHGWARYTFALNAALALVSATVYFCVRFPPGGKKTPGAV